MRAHGRQDSVAPSIASRQSKKITSLRITATHETRNDEKTKCILNGI